MTRRNKNKVFIVMVAVLLTTAVTVFALTDYTDNFSLAYMKWNRSKYIKTVSKYPLVQYKVQNSDNCTLKVTLSKKAYLGLGFENVEVAHTDISGNKYSYTKFKEHTANKEYLITTLNTTSNSIANAEYTFTS